MISGKIISLKDTSLTFKFWGKVEQFAKKMKTKHQSKTVEIINVNLPTPHTIIFKYKIVETGFKYELALQGDYRDFYKNKSEGIGISKSYNINLKDILIHHHKYSIQIK